MNRRNALIGLLGAAAAVAMPLAAGAAKVIVVETAPPAIREESVPHERRGYVWAPGHWHWDHGHYVWVKGRYVKARHGHHWVADTWHEEDHKWRFEVGHWDRD
jgi:hypothetical protein